MANRRESTDATITPPKTQATSVTETAAPPFQPPSDTQGHLAFVLAAFAVAVAAFLIVLVMISASNA